MWIDIPAKLTIMITSIIAGCLTLILRFMLQIENRRRDKKMVGGVEQKVNQEFLDLTDRENGMFRVSALYLSLCLPLSHHPIFLLQQEGVVGGLHLRFQCRRSQLTIGVSPCFTLVPTVNNPSNPQTRRVIITIDNQTRHSSTPELYYIHPYT